jgi:small subunit ribosomal protein S17
MAENETTEAENETTGPENETTGPETTGTEVTETEAAQATVPSPAPAAGSAPAAATGDVTRENHRKVREGLVVSIAMDKTAVVAVTERVRHRRYAKTVQRTRKLYVHDEENVASNGDRVRVAETRPYSKTKRWRLVEVVERAR